jgi:hypothetical protein
MLISLIVYSPVLFMKTVRVEYSSNSTEVIDFKVTRTEFGKSKAGMWIMIAINSTRIILVTVVLMILNIVAIIKFNTFFERKSNLNSKCVYVSFFQFTFIYDNKYWDC